LAARRPVTLDTRQGRWNIVNFRGEAVPVAALLQMHLCPIAFWESAITFWNTPAALAYFAYFAFWESDQKSLKIKKAEL